MGDEATMKSSDQFLCNQCNLSLIGQRYILNDEKPYCVNCYEENFSHVCQFCKEKIKCDSKVSELGETFMLLFCSYDVIILKSGFSEHFSIVHCFPLPSAMKLSGLLGCET